MITPYFRQIKHLITYDMLNWSRVFDPQDFGLHFQSTAYWLVNDI